MGIFDFLKKREEVKKEVVEFRNLSLWLGKREVEINSKRREFLAVLKKRIAELVVELTEELYVLSKINIEEKKEKERIKAIVKENHNNYMIHLERLISKLSDVHEDKDIIAGLNSIFSDFQKRSLANYEKATFLIGKEMGAVKESIKVFFKEMEAIVNDNSELINEYNIVDMIRQGVSYYEVLKEKKVELKEEIEASIKDISRLKDLSKKKEKEIEELKLSEEYIQEVKKRDNLRELKTELGNSLNELGSVINFKALTNYYHSFEKKMVIIKGYRDDFKWHFNRDGGEAIIELLKEAELYDELILKWILKIEKLQTMISGIKIKETGLSELKGELEELHMREEKTSAFVLEERKKVGKMEENLREERERLRLRLLELNIELS